MAHCCTRCTSLENESVQQRAKLHTARTRFKPYAMPATCHKVIGSAHIGIVLWANDCCSTLCLDDCAVLVGPFFAEAQCCLPLQVTDLEGEVLDLKGQLADLEAIRLDLEGHVQDLSDELHGAAAERADKAKAVKVS